VVLAVAAFASLLLAPAPVAWPSYVNVRYGFAICYPASLLNPQPEADNGDGRRFLGRDGAELRVFGQYNAVDATLAAWAEDEARLYTGRRGRISYRAGRGNWIVLSGTDGAKFEFYTKTLERNGEFVTLQFKYPIAEAKRYRAVVDRLSRCLRLTRDPER
jgi:hypothetical protein